MHALARYCLTMPQSPGMVACSPHRTECSSKKAVEQRQSLLSQRMSTADSPLVSTLVPTCCCAQWFQHRPCRLRHPPQQRIGANHNAHVSGQQGWQVRDGIPDEHACTPTGSPLCRRLQKQLIKHHALVCPALDAPAGIGLANWIRRLTRAAYEVIRPSKMVFAFLSVLQ